MAAARRRRRCCGWLRDPEFLARVGDGVVAAEDQRLLLKSWAGADDRRPSRTCRCSTSCATPSATSRPGTRTTTSSTTTSADDLQELTTAADREYAPTGRPWTPPTHRIEDDGFAHVLVDEAQDLTPMQWRMVGRRGRAASWTIVGDPAQSSWPAPAEAAAARAERAGRARTQHEFHLSTNYRNSAEIYAFAAAYADRVGLEADLPTAVRSTGVEPVVRAGASTWRRATREAVPAIAGAVSGTVGHRRPRRPALGGQRLAGRAGRSWPRTRPGRGPLSTPRSPPSGEDRIVVLTGLDTKGLEFDGIVVVCARGDRGGVGHRPGHPLRRAHPRHPAADHRLLSRPGTLAGPGAVRRARADVPP